jgi:hypothetical protein
MASSFGSYDVLNKQDLFFIWHVANNLALHEQKLYTNLSKIKWLHGIICIL